jgi:2-oxo-3-hexenedioate decarboxylase
VERFASQLDEAVRERATIELFTAQAAGFDVAAAYEVQRVCYERRIAAGDTPLGYKLGLTSRAKQEAMGVAEPLWGRLTARMLLAEEEPLELATLIHPRAEPELAFLIAREIDGATATTASVLAATEAVFPALEILDSRYENFKFTLPDVIADNASAARVVVGGRALSAYACDWQLEGMVLRHDGAVVETAAGAAVSGHPAAAVAWLASQVGSVPAGAIVLSGGLTAPVTLDVGSTVTAQFTNLGSVTLRCR